MGDDVIKAFNPDGLLGGGVENIESGFSGMLKDMIMFKILEFFEGIKMYLVEVVQILAVCYVLYNALMIMFDRRDKDYGAKVYIGLVFYAVFRMFWKVVLHY